ncbi:LutC/YkgG family protein [Paenibacillus lentus]|uniref:Lactate utilization protein C n=1 Tax=Paenibacillus lentus TaxID=1338368 RepID=A0A3S8RXE2_9BACL|nr:lactate utilization protein [Paenibacillus lentus]AZK47463.1 lactate utilization protein C [Paenibacillus lentus]
MLNSSHEHDQDDWLDRMETESRTKQKQFISRIAARLKRPRMIEAPTHPFRGAPEFWKSFQWSEQERIKQFTQNFISVGGHVVHLASMEEVSAFIVDKARELQAKYLVRQNEPDLDELHLDSKLSDAKVTVWNSNNETPSYWKERSAEADIGIVIADQAVAFTGSVVVTSSPHKGRSVSLLPTVLMIIIPVERLKTRLGEVLLQFDELDAGQLPAGIHFISGPSRSSDIENDLTIGVHGPGIVYALLVGSNDFG